MMGDGPHTSEWTKSKHALETFSLELNEDAICLAKGQFSHLFRVEKGNFPNAPVFKRWRNLASDGCPRRRCHSSDVADRLIAGKVESGR